MSDVQGKSFGVQNDPLGQNKKIGLWKKIKNAFLGVKFAPQNRYFSVFLKMLKSGHFVLQISPWKLRRQKKLSTPWQSQRKILWNYHLRFFNFETLSPQSSLILEKNWFSHFMIRIFKETITAFKRINRFSIYQYQNQKDKGPEILVYLVALTKKFDKIFLALQKSRFTQNFPQNLQFRRSLKKPSQLLNG